MKCFSSQSLCTISPIRKVLQQRNHHGDDSSTFTLTKRYGSCRYILILNRMRCACSGAWCCVCELFGVNVHGVIWSTIRRIKAELRLYAWVSDESRRAFLTSPHFIDIHAYHLTSNVPQFVMNYTELYQRS